MRVTVSPSFLDHLADCQVCSSNFGLGLVSYTIALDGPEGRMVKWRDSSRGLFQGLRPFLRECSLLRGCILEQCPF